jgi:methanogenic corrinoid protein MtbC1
MSRIASTVSQSYLQALLAGDRAATRKVVDSTITGGFSALDLLNDLVWPTMELLQQLYRDDRISISSFALSFLVRRATARRC